MALSRVSRDWIPRTSLRYASRSSVGRSALLNDGNSVFNGSGLSYIEHLEQSWRADPMSISPDWVALFSQLGDRSSLAAATAGEMATRASDQPTGSARLTLGLLRLLAYYRERGHDLAATNPLSEAPPSLPPSLSGFGLEPRDLDCVVAAEAPEILVELGPLFALASETVATLRDALHAAYTGPIGFEVSRVGELNPEALRWLQDRIERPQLGMPLAAADRLKILDRLVWVTQFERFLGLKFSTAKRFGLEGCETLVVGLKALIDEGSELGIDNVVIGMAHRGRLNVVANALRKPFSHIFHEFMHGTQVPKDDAEIWGASGDVKYHLGTSCERVVHSGVTVHLSLLSNPSHLESVNPLVEGKTRAKQDLLGGDEQARRSVLPVQIHGDAAVVGQGVVCETLNMSGLDHYKTGGTVHIIVNNQIGFTTEPRDARTARYCTAPFHMLNMPIVHVNADDPEAVVRVLRLAVAYRTRFLADIVIDIVGYRRLGHNEIDEPSFTQPGTYRRIRAMPNAWSMYRDRLVGEGVTDRATCDGLERAIKAHLEEQLAAAPGVRVDKSDWLESHWTGFKAPSEAANPFDTAASREGLVATLRALATIPEGMALHPVIQRAIKARQATLEQLEAGDLSGSIDWATAESLALGTLSLEGYAIRLSGQDVQRGTFGHRHAVWIDQQTNASYTPLVALSHASSAAPVSIINSPLSEFGCLGFELGYSLETPNAFVCWEAQFGDFANGAQVIIDQFISCGEQKWFRQSGIVLLLPHGYEGQGPEHSSARLERFLQLSDLDPQRAVLADPRSLHQTANWSVAQPTTPANLFHLFRRQLHRQFRKPLVLLTPKSLLRRPETRSAASELLSGTSSGFVPLIVDEIGGSKPDAPTQILFCSGKVYLDLRKEASAAGEAVQTIVARIEELMPFPLQQTCDLLRQHSPRLRHIVWAQDEPQNMGAATFARAAIQACIDVVAAEEGGSHLRNLGVAIAARPASAAPAVGSAEAHEKQRRDLVKAAIWGAGTRVED